MLDKGRIQDCLTIRDLENLLHHGYLSRSQAKYLSYIAWPALLRERARMRRFGALTRAFRRLLNFFTQRTPA